MTSDRPNPDLSRGSQLLTESFRAKTYLLLEDLWRGRGGETEEPWTILEELLQSRLGRLQLGYGACSRERVQAFLKTATDEEFLDLIELAPHVEESLYEQSLSGHAFRRAPDNLQGLMAKIVTGFNSLLSDTGFPVRFNSEGTLDRKGWPPSSAATPSSAFARAIRAKIYLFLCDHCSDFKSGSVNPWYILQEVLMRRLGILEVGHGYSPEEQVKNFVLEASDEEMLELLQMVPVAELMISNKLHQQAYSNPFELRAYEGLDRRVRSTALGLNSILSDSESPARFQEDGVLNREPSALSEIHALSELPSKETLRTELGRFLQGSQPTSLLMIDLDRFKAINDSLTHLVGDQCLEKCATAIQASILFKGKLYRYGGDEMVVLLKNHTASEAFAVAERIRGDIERTEFPSDASLSASIGVACTSDLPTVSYEALLEAADKAMYKSKNAGGNRTTVYAT